MAADPTMPGSVSASDSREAVTQLVAHEDAPAFSDVATTATAAPTSPLTTFSPTTPRLPISLPPQKSSKDRASRERKVTQTTGSLATQVPPNTRGLDSENKPVAPLLLQRSQSWNPFPAEAPSLVRTNKGEARETAVKTKPSQGDPLLSPTSTSQVQGTTMMSETITTNTPVITMQTAGRHVFLKYSAEHQKPLFI